MTTYLESLRNRLHRYGVRVVTAKPGFVRTAMTEGRLQVFDFRFVADDEEAVLRAGGAVVAKIWEQLAEENSV